MYMFGGYLLETIDRTTTLHIQKTEQLDDVQSQGSKLQTWDENAFIRMT